MIARALSVALSILGLLTIGAAWAMAVDSLWPLVLLAGIALLLTGVGIGFTVVTDLMKKRTIRQIQEMRRRQE